MKSVIIGAGTYGEVYLAYLQETKYEIVGFVDDDPELWNTCIQGIPVLGGKDILLSLKKTHEVEAVFCPIGNNQLRVSLLSYAKELNYKTPNYIHSSATISPHVKLGEGVYILIGANIMPYTIIEDYVMISMSANIAHHCTLSKGTFISTGVNFGASIIAHKNAYIGIAATIMTGIKYLGENCLIGAGAVVIKDVPEKAVMAGVPAKIIKYKE